MATEAEAATAADHENEAGKITAATSSLYCPWRL